MAKSSNTEGYIHHYGAVRMRVTGSGALQMKLISLDDVRELELVDFTLAATTNIEPTRLCNFTDQSAYLEIKTTEIDERFEISKIVIFTKPVASNRPG